jgi:ATP-dependent protease ClpP protease subunit
VLFLAADIRRAAPFSTFLIHECTIGFAGPIGDNLLRETLKTLEFDSNRYAEIFDERTQKRFDVRAYLSGAADRMSANDAVGVGLLTEPPIEPVIPVGATLWTIKPA